MTSNKLLAKMVEKTKQTTTCWTAIGKILGEDKTVTTS